MIVVLDGYRVHGYSQYRCIRRFTDDPVITLIAWHGGKYVEMSGRFNERVVASAPP